jgi:TRAP-type C4-dicarboxylate transport system permease small subunit
VGKDMAAECQETLAKGYLEESHGTFAKALLKVLRFIMISMSLTVAVVIGVAAALRYVFKMDMYGIEDFIIVFAYWLYFSGGAYGAFENSHITADILTVYMKNQKLKRGIICFSSLCTVLLSGLFAYWGWLMFSWQLAKGGATPVWRIPLYVPQSAITLGLTLMTFYFALHFMENLRLFRKALSGKAEV